MKKSAAALIALVAFTTLAGCVAYPVHTDHGGRHYSHRDRDRDGDGVPNRYDRRPDNPRRY